MFYVFELTYPGTWLDYPDRDWTWHIENLLRQLETPIADAATALAMFEQERRRPHESHDRGQWEAETRRRQEIEGEIARERGIDRYSPDHWEDLRFSAEVAFKREKWTSGRLPDSYQHRLPFVHAKSYLFAMDRLERTVAVLAKQPNVPEDIADAPEALRELMPALRGVRNSVAHHEDRSRGLGRRGQPLDLKPVDNEFVHSPGGALIMESLNNNRFGSTMADGHYGEIEVSHKTLGAVRDVVQRILDAFEWKGPPQHVPR